MPSIKLTDRYAASVDAPPGKRLDLFDKQVPGLILRVNGTGRKTFYYRYRTPDGRQPRYKLGTYPTLKLADARDAAIRLAGQLGGIDPAIERRKTRQAAKSVTIRTFGELANVYLSACEHGEWMPKGKKKRKRTLDDDRAVYRRYVKDVLGNMPLREVTSAVVRKLLRDMLAKGIHAQTNRTQAFIRQVFNYGIAEIGGEHIAFNPAQFPPMGEVRARTRVLKDYELAKFWEALTDDTHLRDLAPSDYERSFLPGRAMRIALQLCLLLLARESEVAGMEIEELDLSNATWCIPAERMKSGRPHLVPLPPIAVELIREAITIRRDEDSPYVFPSPRRNVTKPVRGESLGHAMKRIITALDVAPASPHDLRRTGATRMTSERVGVLPFIRSKVLGHHTDAGGGAAVSTLHYDMNEYVSEKRQALMKWADVLAEICRAPTMKDPTIAMGSHPNAPMSEAANLRQQEVLN